MIKDNIIFIQKRDGSYEKFNRQKIKNAINAAMIEVDGQLYENDTATSISQDIKNDILNNEIDDTVESIQDAVEEYLMASERKDVARAYVRYRYKREVAREFRNDFLDAIAEPLSATDTKQQNANVDEQSHGGRVGEASNLVTSLYAFERLISPMAKRNHDENMIYIHDRSAFATGMHNCETIPIDDLAKNGCKVRGSRILRPCKSFTSFSQCSAVYMQLQSLEQFGGVSYSHYDWSAVPYVRLSFRKHFIKGLQYFYSPDDYEIPAMTTEEIREMSIESDEYKYFAKAYNYAIRETQDEVFSGIEALYHNLNTLQSRSGNQLPFSSINYGTCTLPEGRMVTKALLENSIIGIGEKHTTPIFPCGIFQLMKGVNREPGDPNYDLYKLALKSTAHRLYPNYANVDWSGNAGYDRNDPRTYFSTMGLVILAHVKSFELRPQVSA